MLVSTMDGRRRSVWDSICCCGLGKDRVTDDADAIDDSDDNVSISSLASKLKLDEKNCTTAIAEPKNAVEKENHNVIPRILGGREVWTCHVEEWSVALRPCQLVRAIVDAVAGSLDTTEGKKIFKRSFCCFQSDISHFVWRDNKPVAATQCDQARLCESCKPSVCQ